MIKKIYIAGPLFNVHEKKYLEEIAEVLEGADFECFLPHRDQKGIDPEELKNNEMSQATKDIIFKTDIEALKEADVVLYDALIDVSLLEYADKAVNIFVGKRGGKNYLSQDELDKVAADTMVGGATLTGLLGTSAWYAPGAAAAQMVEAIVRDQKRVFPVCAMLDGEYGMKNIFLGVPVVLGKNGIERIIELDLNDDEKALLAESAEAVKNVMTVLDNMNVNA